ncbi:MAG: uroporphyrinogen-III synthase [Pseudomonadota bacterium]
MTRTPEASRQFLTLLPEMPALISPLLKIETLSPPPPDGPISVAFTSANAVRAFATLRSPDNEVAYCVGQRTAAEAAKAGYKPISADGAVEDLAHLICRTKPDQSLIYPCGRTRAGDLPQLLADCGIISTVLEVYDQVPQRLSQEALDLLRGPSPVIVPLFSPRTARVASAQMMGGTAPIWAIFMSQNVAAAWAGPRPSRSSVASRPDSEAMAASIRMFLA